MPGDIANAGDDYLARLTSGISDYHAPRISKLRRGHVKLVYSKALELTARRLRIGIKRTATLFWGRRLTVVYPEPTSLAVSRYGFYEEGLTKMVLRYLKPGMTFVDVGAHVGYFTLLGAWLVGESGHVHSFEPTPSTFEILKSNVNKGHNICLNQAAVTSEPGSATLNDFGPAYSGYNSMYRPRMASAELGRLKVTQFKTPAVSIDDYVARNDIVPNFVKIDAESAEFEILRGMEQTIGRYRPIISVEVGDMDIEGVISCRDLVTHVIDQGYQAYDFSGVEIVEHQLRDRYDYENILFLPNS